MSDAVRRLACAVMLVACVPGVASALDDPAELPAELPAEHSLFRDTLAQDIATSSFHELVTWLEVLGLSTRGDRPALVGRLAAFYEIPPEEIERARPIDRRDATPPLVVDSATRTRYFTLEQVDERYIRLSGGVILTLRDEERDAVHRIHADEIVFNEEQRTLAASGSVRYVLERGGTTEQFTGEALTVELDDWEGAFVQGVTQRERTIDGERIDFMFGGTYITRSRDDVIVLDDGVITSSEADPPNYSIRANKIWVLAPGEWGLRHAVLYVGRVPLAYMPLFFRPGNRLFFNPSLGTRDRAGGYIQTTTYLAGTPEDPESAFSLLQLAEEEGPQTEREIRGLFLVPKETPTGDPPAPDATLRLLADVYTKLGAFVGLDGSWPEIGPLQQVRMYLAVATSRHLYEVDTPGGGVAYTPYFIDTESGETRHSWNTTDVGPVTLPFRYGLEFSARASAERLTANARFEAYSDRRFRADFGDRSEDIDWLGLLGQGGPPGAVPPPVTSLLWQLDTSYRVDVSGLQRVDRLALQRGVVAMNWRSREIAQEQLPREVARAHESPQSAFFYPTSMRLPELSLVASGTLLSHPARPREPDRPPTTAPPPAIIPPWGRPEVTDEPDEAEPSRTALAIPPIQPALPAPRLPDPFAARIGYAISPLLIVDQTFLDSPWVRASDVDYAVAHAGATVRATGSLTHTTAMRSDLIRADGTLATGIQYRDVFNRNLDLDDPGDASTFESLQRQAWNFTSFSLTHNLTVRALPLRGTRLWSGSTVSYTANLMLYQYLLDEIVENEPVWKGESIDWDDERFFRQHQIQTTAALGLEETQSLQVAAALPPLDERYTGALSLRFSPVSVTASTGVRRPEDDWVFDPLAAGATVAPRDDLSVGGSLSYDIENEWLSFYRTNLRAGPLTAEYEARRSVGYEFLPPGGDVVGWRPVGEEMLRPATARVGLSLSSDYDPFWRNRVIAQVTSSLTWSANLQRFTESSLRHTFRGLLVVHRFVRLSVETVSVNAQSYVYVPRLAREVGREPRGLLEDFLRSFNVFNRDDRVRSGFDLQSIRVSAVHDLGDWDLTVGYVGRPQLETADEGTRSYQWRGTVDLRLQWRPVREISSSVTIDEEAIVFGSDS